jgi:hypothetical protein
MFVSVKDSLLNRGAFAYHSPFVYFREECFLEIETGLIHRELVQ